MSRVVTSDDVMEGREDLSGPRGRPDLVPRDFRHGLVGSRSETGPGFYVYSGECPRRER